MKRQIPLTLAFEDILSEYILVRIIDYVNQYGKNMFLIGAKYHKSGFGYLKKNIRAFNKAADVNPILLLTDLDTHTCPISLIREWLNIPQSPNLIFRVAVREVESWLLSDSDGFSKFLRISNTWYSQNPDFIVDPKSFLISLAKRSPSRNLREAIVPKMNSTAKIGPDYNTTLGNFVKKNWNIDDARKTSTSLDKLIKALEKFNSTI